MAYCCHFFCVWFTKLCVSQLNSQESIHRILCLCARKCKNKAVVNVWYSVARFSNTRKIPQYPAKNNTIPHFICTSRSVLSEWEPYYVLCATEHSSEQHSASSSSPCRQSWRAVSFLLCSFHGDKIRGRAASVLANVHSYLSKQTHGTKYGIILLTWATVRDSPRTTQGPSVEYVLNHRSLMR